MTYRIRPSTLSDTETLGRIHAQAWRESYTGLLSEELIANAGSIERRTTIRRRMFADSTPEWGHFLVETEQGEVVGFGDCGPAHEVKEFASAEIFTLYLLRSAQGQGIGKKLLLKMLGHLANLGFENAALKANIKNEKALRFYQHLGGAEVQRMEANYDGVIVPLVVYAWYDLKIFKQT